MTIIKIAEITFEYLLIKLFDFDFIPIKFPIKINIKLKINVNIVANSIFIPEMLAAIPVAMLLTDNATIIFIMSFLSIIFGVSSSNFTAFLCFSSFINEFNPKHIRVKEPIMFAKVSDMIKFNSLPINIDKNVMMQVDIPINKLIFVGIFAFFNPYVNPMITLSRLAEKL